MKLVCVNREIVWCLCVCLGKSDNSRLLMDRGVLFEGWSWRGVVGGGGEGVVWSLSQSVSQVLYHVNTCSPVSAR